MNFLGDTKRMTGLMAMIMMALLSAVMALNALGFKIDPTITQTIIVLATGVASFYFGTSSGSKAKDDKLIGSEPPAPEKPAVQP